MVINEQQIDLARFSDLLKRRGEYFRTARDMAVRALSVTETEGKIEDYDRLIEEIDREMNDLVDPVGTRLVELGYLFEDLIR